MEEIEEKMICPECGTENPAGKILCINCGFNLELIRNNEKLQAARKIEEELKGTKVEANKDAYELEKIRLLRLNFTTSLYLAVVLTVATLAIFFFFSRLMSSVALQTDFYRDSERFVNSLLKIQALIEMDGTKAEFDELTKELLAESFRYKSKYEGTRYRTSRIYIELTKSAQFYILGRDTWENQLRATYGRAISTAMISGVSEDVLKYWVSAKNSLKDAIKRLRKR